MPTCAEAITADLERLRAEDEERYKFEHRYFRMYGI